MQNGYNDTDKRDIMTRVERLSTISFLKTLSSSFLPYTEDWYFLSNLFQHIWIDYRRGQIVYFERKAVMVHRGRKGWVCLVYFLVTLSGSSRIPSASSLLRASSRAHVCILDNAHVSSLQKRSYANHSELSPTIYRSTAPVSTTTLLQRIPNGNTHEVSGLKAYAIPATMKLPTNPYANSPSHPSFTYF